jgi:hypothetical protein
MYLCAPKGNVPNSTTYLNWTLIFEWCVVRCGSKNGHQNDVMCLKGNELRAHNFVNHSSLNSHQHN